MGEAGHDLTYHCARYRQRGVAGGNAPRRDASTGPDQRRASSCLAGQAAYPGCARDLVVDIPLIAGAVAAVVRAVTRYLIERERQRRDPGWKIIIHAEDSVEINADRVRSADIRELVELIIRNGHRDAGE